MENETAHVKAKTITPKKETAVKESREVLLQKALKMGLKNRRALNVDELSEVTKASTSKARIEEISKKAVARWRSGLASAKKKK